MKYLAIAIVTILTFVVSCNISTTAYEETLLEACADKEVVTLLKTKTSIGCKIIKRQP